jgi:hypothetical protein
MAPKKKTTSKKPFGGKQAPLFKKGEKHGKAKKKK